MSVPSTAYQVYTLKHHFNGVLQREYSFAKYLAAYPDENTIKAKFKVDGILKESSTSFIGYLNIATENDLFHDTSQIGIVWHEKRLLADAGLNRKANASILKVLNTGTDDYNLSIDNYPPRINNLRIFFWFESPIYNALTSGTIEVSSDGLFWTTLYTKSSMGEDTSFVGWIDNPSVIERSGIFYFRVKALNDVGTFTSTTFNCIVKMVSDSFKFDASNASDAVNGQDRTVYRDTLNFISYLNEGNDATSFFSNENTTPTQASTGFYVKNNTWYQYIYNANVGRNVLYDFGPCGPGSFPQGDPGNIVHTPEEVNYSGYDRDSLEQAEWEVNSGNYDYNTLYLDTVVDYDNNTTIIYAYSDSSHSTFARDGFYVAGEMVEGITSEIQVFNGIATIL